MSVAVQASAQTGRQSNIRSVWDDSDAPRPRGDGMLRDVMLSAHNRARAAVRVPPLDWDAGLAAEAQGYARELARTGQFRHSAKLGRTRPEGENLWMGTRDAFDYTEMAGSWSDERRYYVSRAFPDISTTGNWADVGHYTQMVWRGTAHVGCGLASSDSDDYLVCRYDPPGNVYGQTVTSTAMR